MLLAVLRENISLSIIVPSAGATMNVYQFIMATVPRCNGILFQNPLTIPIILKQAIRIGNIMAMAVSGAANIYQPIIIYLRTAITATRDLMVTAKASRNLLIIQTTLYTIGAVIVFTPVREGFIIS